MYKDKVVIVTGASNGIGKAIAKAYLQEDVYVILADIDEEQGKHVLDSIEQKERAIFIKTDVRNEADIIQMVETTQAKFGKIDILINNAGKGIFKLFYDLTR
ncbi:SDR family NAD(P)-dependent oxidoreductase [Streptococcus hyovaginalis]